jgi:methylated-DNA-[protein]-cysteine S-methyltransferase
MTADRCWTAFQTLWGWVSVIATGASLDYVGFPEPTEDDAVVAMLQEARRPGQPDPDGLGWCEEPIRRYFRGERLDWLTLPVGLAGTPFQVQVYAAARAIPYGHTRSYGEIAGESGAPRAARAVGTAMARNPHGLLIPCHRVVAANGLGGYGRHPDRKRALLRLEGAREGQR